MEVLLCLFLLELEVFLSERIGYVVCFLNMVPFIWSSRVGFGTFGTFGTFVCMYVPSSPVVSRVESISALGDIPLVPLVPSSGISSKYRL